MEHENEKTKVIGYQTKISNSLIKNNNILILQIVNLFLIVFLISLYLFNQGKDSFGSIKERAFNLIDNNDDKINTFSNSIKLLKMLTNNDEKEYKGIEICLLNEPDKKNCIYHLISPKQVFGKKRILIGEKRDGGYVLLDDFKNIKIAYSFGIEKNVIFDKALADKGIDIYMYDHTIKFLPYKNPKFHWKKIGLCGKNNNNPNMKTLEELIADNGHINEKDMILKIDIEHWEWESIIDLKEETLNKFKYIAIEYHFKDEKVYSNTNIYYKVLKKISKTHQSFYARCNGNKSKKVNFGNNRICHILEVSYIIKKDNIFIKDESVYPIYEFDYSKPYTGKSETNLNILTLFSK